MAGVNSLIDEVVAAFQADPRNKVYAEETLPLESAKQELGAELTPEELRTLVQDYESGELEEKKRRVVRRRSLLLQRISTKMFRR